MKYKVITRHTVSAIYKHLQEMLIDHQEVETNYEFLFLIGGDGTLIRELNNHKYDDVKIIHIRLGTSTFFGHELNQRLVDQSISTDSLFREYQIINLLVNDQHRHTSINEIYLRGNLLLEGELSINHICLQHIRSSAFVLSTQLGSSGIHKSIKSPLLLPSARAWVISNVHPQTNKYCLQLDNPVVLSEEDCVQLKIKAKDCSIFIDNQQLSIANHNAAIVKIDFSIAKSKARLLNLSCTESYLNSVKRHFINWTQNTN